jgi:hypothetical protein
MADEIRAFIQENDGVLKKKEQSEKNGCDAQVGV